MKILFASSEAHPLIKTGGLADVSGALPAALKALGHDVRLILPAYGEIHKRQGSLDTLSQINIPGLPGLVSLLHCELGDSGVPVILVDYDPAFARLGNPYSDANNLAWKDNAERFALFCRAIVAVALDQADLNWKPDVLHCNDWQTGLAPALLHGEMARPTTLFTIHNLAYQGLFPARYAEILGLPPSLWSPTAMEFYGQLSFIKGGLVYADCITTVSPNYMEEIKTPAFGCGLDGLLRHRQKQSVGIINGIDTDIWSPEHDTLIEKNYTIENFNRNKGENKKALQAALHLDIEPKHMLVGFIGRLVEQKGIDMILDWLRQSVPPQTQVVILGSGDPEMERQLLSISNQRRDKIVVRIGYDESMAHLIEAAADVFLMPSRFEPCGLNQMYSMRYGTVPIVTPVGGLKDTVTPINKENLRDRKATGVIIDENQINSEGLTRAIKVALELYQQPKTWNNIVRNGMRQDFSWLNSAQRYIKLYQLGTGTSDGQLSL